VRALRAFVGTDRIKGSALAELIGTTPGYVSQVVNPLVKAGWVRSDPGPTGGYSLTVDLDGVSVLAVIEAVEGGTLTGSCVLADRPCDEGGNCAMHVPWQRARDTMLRELAAVSVADDSIHVELGPQ